MNNWLNGGHGFEPKRRQPSAHPLRGYLNTLETATITEVASNGIICKIKIKIKMNKAKN
jgi:hypothetical protein